MPGHEFERTLTQSDKPRIVLGGLVYESNCPLCTRAVATFRRILGDLDLGGGSTALFDLEREWPIAPFAATNEISAVIRELSETLGSHALYQKLEAIGQPVKMRRQGLEHPHLTVLLKSAHLLDPERRRALANALAEHAKSVAAFTIVCFGDRGQQALLELNLSTAREWLAGFEPLASCQVALYIAVPALDGGRPIEPAILADLVGICLAKDVIVDSRQPFRSLTPYSNDSVHIYEHTLGAFGLKAIWFSPSALAEAWRDHFVRDLLQSTSVPTSPRPQPLSVESVPSPDEILRRAVKGIPNCRISLKSLSSDAKTIESMHGMPHLAGHDAMRHCSIALTLVFKHREVANDLASTPMHDWLEVVYTQDFLYRKEVVADWTSQLCSVVDTQASAVKSHLTDLVANHLERAPDLISGITSIRDLALRARQTFALRLAAGRAPELELCLAHLGRAMDDLPNRFGLVARTVLLLMVQMLIGKTVLMSTAPWKVALLCAIVSISAMTIGLPILRWMRAAQWLDQAARLAIDTIDGRCRLAGCERVRQTLTSFGVSISEHLEGIAELLESFQQALGPLAEADTNATDSAAPIEETDQFMIRCLPDREQAKTLYAEVIGRELRIPGGRAIEDWTHRIRDGVRQRGGENSSTRIDVAAEAREIASRRLLVNLRSLSIRRFLHSPDTDDQNHDAIRWLLEADQSRRFFFDGRLAASSASSQGNAHVEHLLVPSDLPEVASSDESLPTGISAIHNVVARLARVEIARSDSGGGDA